MCGSEQPIKPVCMLIILYSTRLVGRIIIESVLVLVESVPVVQTYLYD